MNAPAFRITPALCEAADDREARAAAYLIERYRAGLAVAERTARDPWQAGEVKQAIAKVYGFAKPFERGERFAASNVLMFLGPNMHGPWIETVIAAGERRSAARDAEKED